MTPLKLPALDPNAVAEVRGSGYPQPFKARMGDRAKRRLATSSTAGDGSGAQGWDALLKLRAPRIVGAARQFVARRAFL